MKATQKNMNKFFEGKVIRAFVFGDALDKACGWSVVIQTERGTYMLSTQIGEPKIKKLRV